MPDSCGVEDCVEPAIASIGEQPLCQAHFLTDSYRRLEEISVQIHHAQFHETQAEAAGRFLEDCMRYAADVACSPVQPGNLDKARILDVLLWASELHGFLRRGPRVAAKIPLLLRSEAQEKPWEEKVETTILSRHGLQICCGHELKISDILTCVRLDTGRRTQVRVVWTRGGESGKSNAGLEFVTDENFWELDAGGAWAGVS